MNIITLSTVLLCALLCSLSVKAVEPVQAKAATSSTQQVSADSTAPSNASAKPTAHLETTIQLDQQQPLFLSIVPWKVQGQTELTSEAPNALNKPGLALIEPEQLQMQLHFNQLLLDNTESNPDSNQ